MLFFRNSLADKGQLADAEKWSSIQMSRHVTPKEKWLWWVGDLVGVAAGRVDGGRCSCLPTFFFGYSMHQNSFSMRLGLVLKPKPKFEWEVQTSPKLTKLCKCKARCWVSPNFSSNSISTIYNWGNSGWPSRLEPKAHMTLQLR